MISRGRREKKLKNLLTFVSPYNNIYVSPKERRVGNVTKNRQANGNPKKHETRIRMSDEDVEILEYCCNETGMSKADVIQARIFREIYAKIKK